MSIWENQITTSVTEAPPPMRAWSGFEGWLVPDCPYCQSKLKTLGGKTVRSSGGKCPQLDVCPVCGWWVISIREDHNRGSEGEILLYRSWGALCKLDITDISIPINELRTHLLAKFENRFKVHPRKYEELVASVFSDFGFRVRVTSYTGDDGIDIYILDGSGDDVVGIQVKRYKGKIEAEQIRSFAGALMLKGVTEGVFVTSGEYRSGAIETAAKYSNKGTSILLQDAKAFYDTMRIVQRAPFESKEDPSAPFYSLCKNPDDIPYLWTHAW